MVEEAVVLDVDEKLRGGGMRVVGARHGDGVAVVLQAVVGFILDRRAGRLLLHARLEAAALDHEAVDDAVKDRAVVMAGLNVVNEVLDGFRRFVGIQFEGDDAEVGVQFDHGIFLRLSVFERRREGGVWGPFAA